MLTEAGREGRFQFDAKRLSAAPVPNGSENFPERLVAPPESNRPDSNLYGACMGLLLSSSDFGL
jgi:hypothetical protein